MGAASGLLANDPPVTLAKVDCTEGGKSTCGRFDVKGYPTLKIFRNGELSSDYNGPREAAGISKFMRSQVGPASKEVKTVAEAEAVLAKPEVVVFGFGDQPAHAKAAAKLRESVLFAHTTSEEVMTKLGHKDAIVLFRPKTLQNKFESAEVIYEGADPVDKWVKANYHGICGVRTTDNAADFPTLYWLPKGSKKPTSYNGGREIDDFIKYIAEHASDELKGYDRKGKEKKV